MALKFFNKSEVLKSLNKEGYFIHTHTSNEARLEANQLTDDLTEYMNKENGLENSEYNENRIIVNNQEVAPCCNYGIIYSSERFEKLYCKEDMDINKLITEIESQKIVIGEAFKTSQIHSEHFQN